MDERVLKSLILPIDDGQGNVDDVKYTIPQGTVTEDMLSEAEGTKADAIVLSASGDIASYDDGGDLPMKSLVVNIVPEQSGTGDPSPDNVRAISGYSEVKIKKCGKNLILVDTAHITKPSWSTADYWVVGGTYGTNGYIANKSNSEGAFGGIWIENLKAGTYKLSGIAERGKSVNNYVRWWLSGLGFTPTYGNVTAHSSTGRFEITLTVPKTTNIVISLIPTSWETGVTHTMWFDKIQLETVSFTDFEPCTTDDIAISFGQTVYGGVLDVVSGKLVINKAGVLIRQFNWAYASAVFYTYLSTPKKAGGRTNIISSSYKTVDKAYADLLNNELAGVPSTNQTGTDGVNIKDTRYTDVSEFVSAMGDTQLVYELATPTEIDLTPTEVKSLLGDNNVWSDSGTVEVEYRADTSLVINKILEALA